MARRKMGLDESEIPDWEFVGFHYPYEQIVDMYLAYRDHGTLLVAGGYLDQPPEYWQDIRTCEALFNTRYAENVPEYENKLKADRD